MRALVSLMTLSFQNVRLFKTPSIVLVIDNDYFVYCLFLVFLISNYCARSLVHMTAHNHDVATEHRERKCADMIGTVPVPWSGHFQC